jgi:hypothetical protein
MILYNALLQDELYCTRCWDIETRLIRMVPCGAATCEG